MTNTTEAAREGTDLLVVTYNRAEYVKVTLPHLLESCDESTRVWIWQNGSDPETLEVVRALKDHARVHEFHHSEENVFLREPTNWLWSNAKGRYLSKVDDDAILPEGWLQTLRKAHEDYPKFGVLGCWRSREEDFIAELADAKISAFAGHEVLRSLWTEGSGYLMKYSCVAEQGPLQGGQSFTDYCIELSRRGWINGWYHPFLYQEDMDDARSPYSLLKTDEDLQRYLPLGALKRGITTLEEWQDRRRYAAREALEASIDPRAYTGWRRRLRNVRTRLKGLTKGSGKRVKWDDRW